MSQARPNASGVPTGRLDEPGAPSSPALAVRAAPEASDLGSAPTLRAPTADNAAIPTTGVLPEVDPSRYAIIDELAHGGIGRILRARDLHLDRPVALKELLAPDRGAEARFVAEALVTARLQHPSIVPVYEAGRWPGGEPFYAMRLVSGRSLVEVINERKRLEERLALLPHVLAVAEAIAYAHSERIIHRDLKPANVLVGSFGETVVIDWGLAKDLTREEPSAPELPSDPSSSAAQEANLTRVGTVVGTPAYMPPEQAVGLPVDERADVYALGAILYHLLAGRQPYDGGSSQQVLLRVVQGPPTPLHQCAECIPRDLLAIVAKAMAREPAERYATARELAEDLKRFQTGQIVGAYQYTRVELLRRFLRRYRAAVTVTVVALLLLVGLGTVSLLGLMAERDRAEAQADKLRLEQARSAVKLDPNEAIASLRELSPGFTRWSAVRTIAADARAHGFATVLHGHTKALNDLLFTPDGRYLFTAGDDHAIRRWDLARGTHLVLSGHTDEVWRLHLVPGGRRLVSSSKDGTLRLWDVESGEGERFATLAGPISAFTLSPEGQRLLAISRADDVLHEWNLATGASRTVSTGVRGIADIALAPDGRHVYLRKHHSSDSLVGDLERGTFRLLEDSGSGVLWGFTFSPSGDLITADGLGHLKLWERQGDKVHLLAEGLGAVTALIGTPDGARLFLGTQDGTVRTWDLGTREGKVLGRHEGEVKGLRLSPDGRYLASASADRTARLWELATGEVRILRGAQEQLYGTAFSPDGQRLATASADGQVRLYSVEADTHRVLAATRSTQVALVRSTDGRRLASLSSTGTLRLLDTASVTPPLLEAHGFERGRPVGFSQDDRWLAAGANDGRVFLWEAATGRQARVFQGHVHTPTALAFSHDGRWLVTAALGGEVRLWDVASGAGRVLGEHGKKVYQLAFSPDGRHFASASNDGSARLWDVASGTFQTLRAHQEEVRTLAFSPDGQRLVTGSLDHTLCFWDLGSGQCQRQDANGGGVLEVLFSPDGGLLASRSLKDGRVLLWDGRTGEPRGVLSGHQGDILDLTFSPDGTRLASAGVDGTVRLWDLASGEGRVLRGHTGNVGTVLFLPDGRALLSTGEDGTLRQWPDDLPSDPAALRAWMDTVTGSEPRAPRAH
jgi:WD40 repeat protein